MHTLYLIFAICHCHYFLYDFTSRPTQYSPSIQQADPNETEDQASARKAVSS